MKRQAIRGLLLFGLLVLVVDSNVRAQQFQDAVTIRDHKDNSVKTHNGTLKVSAAGFQVVATDGKIVATINPDDITKFAVGELQGVERSFIQAANAKEDKKEWEPARANYVELLKKTGLPERSKRYLEFKKVQLTHRMVDELDAEKGWAEKADDCIKDWNSFLVAEDTKAGWEQWPAVRGSTRLQIERRKFDDAARNWERVSNNPNMPPDARLEASLQAIDLQIRGGAYSAAGTTANELLKTAVGPKKDRLTIYALAAKAGGDGKPLDGIDKIKAEMDKTKDPSVHATGFSMMGELYLAGKKQRDAMWMFLWVETVLNQDKDEALTPMTRLL
jgi:hypothetical protein